MQFRGAIFDQDGLLFDTEVLFERAWKQAGAEIGLEVPKLGLEPFTCLVFEDALTGIRAAHAAGCHPVMVPDRVQPTEEILSICDCRTSLAEAMDFLER